MFYTKYRPQNFSEIQKPNEVVESLAIQVKQHKTAHAYLFTGPRGTGKTTTARILAKAINYTNIKENGDACDECEFCKSLNAGTFLDLIEIDAASNRGIDDIRDLKDKVKLAPFKALKKIYIIDEVHMLTNEAFNALLKTLEEPPKHVVFILCTTEFHKVPDTIKSRCQVFKFKRATIDQLTQKLSNIAKKEGIEVSDVSLEKIARSSMGAYRDAETLLEQMVTSGSYTFAPEHRDYRYSQLFNFIISANLPECLKTVNEVFSEGEDFSSWCEGFILYLRGILFITSGATEIPYNTTDEVFETMCNQAKYVSPNEVCSLIEILSKTATDSKNFFMPQIFLEKALVLCIDLFKDKKDQNKDIAPAPQSPIKPTMQKKEVTDEPQQVDTEITITETIEITQNQPINEEISQNAQQILADITNLWNDIVKAVAGKNSSVSALLKNSKVSGIEGNNIVLEVSYKFHKERLENGKNRKFVEDALESLMNKPLSIKCVVVENFDRSALKKGETGNLTDFNISIPAAPDVNFDKNLISVFDGGLPL